MVAFDVQFLPEAENLQLRADLRQFALGVSDQRRRLAGDRARAQKGTNGRHQSRHGQGGVDRRRQSAGHDVLWILPFPAPGRLTADLDGLRERTARHVWRDGERRVVGQAAKHGRHYALRGSGPRLGLLPVRRRGTEDSRRRRLGSQVRERRQPEDLPSRGTRC